MDDHDRDQIAAAAELSARYCDALEDDSVRRALAALADAAEIYTTLLVRIYGFTPRQAIASAVAGTCSAMLTEYE